MTQKILTIIAGIALVAAPVAWIWTGEWRYAVTLAAVTLACAVVGSQLEKK